MVTILLTTTEIATATAVNAQILARAFQAVVTGTGAVSATVLIEASNNRENYMTLGTITLSGTTAAADGFVSVAPWEYVRANVTAISGTGATVVVTMGA